MKNYWGYWEWGEDKASLPICPHIIYIAIINTLNLLPKKNGTTDFVIILLVINLNNLLIFEVL